MSDLLVIKIKKPSDELRIQLDDLLSIYADGQCDSWDYVLQPDEPINPEARRKHDREFWGY